MLCTHLWCVLCSAAMSEVVKYLDLVTLFALSALKVSVIHVWMIVNNCSVLNER